VRLVMLDPTDPGPEWQPFTGVRPVGELRVGALKVWERWARVLGASSVRMIAPANQHFADVDSVEPAPLDLVGPAVVATSAFAPVLEDLPLPADSRAIVAGGHTVGWFLRDGERWSGPLPERDGLEIRGLRLGGAIDLLNGCERLLERDCAVLAAEGSDAVPAGAVVLGDPQAVAVRTASVEPHVVFDVRKGPIVLEPDVVVRAGTRLEGPLYVAPHTVLLGGTIRHCSIGPQCRVHGEVANSVFLGYGNKSHDGFVGHSVIGQWVNLGAGTITSNLKNTYGEVRLDLPTGRLATGRANVGTLFGDHAKTAIGTLLSTGTVVGVGANSVATQPPKYLRPFAWGLHDRQSLDGFLTVARRVMPRRGVEVTDAIANSLKAIYQRHAR